jgi:sugar/nucleoside kinase (ribokinase family)
VLASSEVRRSRPSDTSASTATSRRVRNSSAAFRVDARDTTGAGDVFHAAFAWGLLEGLACEPILRAANAAAAMSCRALGAQGGLPTRSELEAFLREQRPAAWREPEAGGR